MSDNNLELGRRKEAAGACVFPTTEVHVSLVCRCELVLAILVDLFTLVVVTKPVKVVRV